MRLTTDQIREDVAELLGEDAAEIEPEDNLVDWGLDSVRLMMLVERWREAGAPAVFADLAERPALAAWVRLLTGSGGAGEEDHR
jgi:aryl carrier-like protein